MNTPWGSSQQIEEIAPGIIFVSTTGHGGYGIAKELWLKMPSPYRSEGIVTRECFWYEEDCDWALVVLSFPEHFSKNIHDAAITTAKTWHPYSYEKVTGTEVPAEESYIKQRDIFYKQNLDNLIVFCAKQMPNNMVKCYAGKFDIQGNRLKNYPEKIFLVPDDEYAKRSSFGFIIDPNNHTELFYGEK